MMNEKIIPLLLILTITMLPILIYAEDRAELRLDWEPEDCGRVYAEPPGENYTYTPGTMIQVYAEAYEGCRFVNWVTDLVGLNGSITNPITFTIFSDTYLKALFIRVGATPSQPSEKPKTHAFLRITANTSRFSEEVRMVPIGGEVMVSVPRELSINDSARYVFVGWEGYNSTELTLRVLVTGDTTVKALYTLYLRFLELWYHYSDFTIFQAPIVDLEPGVRLRPLSLTLKPINISLPLGTKIPREFADRVEVKYVKEYLLTVRSLSPEEVPVNINGEVKYLGSSLNLWIPEGSKTIIKILVDETEKGWITSEKNIILVMDSPKSVLVEYEEKPYSWAAESPLKPLIYPILEYIAREFKDTSLWPQVSQMISQPTIVYSIVAVTPVVLGIIGYVGYRTLSRIEFGKTWRGGKIIEERIRKAKPHELITAVPARSSYTVEDLKVPEDAKPPEWLKKMLNLEEGAVDKPLRVEPAKTLTIIEEGEDEKILDLDPIEEISKLEKIRAEELIEILMSRLDEEVLEALKDAVSSGRLEVLTYRDVWSPIKVRKVMEALENRDAVAVIGGDIYIREKISEWAKIVYDIVYKKDAVTIDDGYVGSIEEASLRIGRNGLVVLGENIGPEETKIYAYAGKLLGAKILKLGEGYGLPTVKISYPSERELKAYMVVKAIFSRVLEKLDYRLVEEVSRIALKTRGYETIDNYISMLSKPEPVDLNTFTARENNSMFDEFEREALRVWLSSGSIQQALIHYTNILSQFNPSQLEFKARIFKEKLLKLSGGGT